MSVFALDASAGTRGVARVDRRESIDRLRGLAMALMMLGHLLAVLDAGEWVRLTLTRGSLPIFAAVTGYLLADRRPRWGRVGQVAGVGLFASAAVDYAGVPGLNAVDPLLVIAAALCCWPLVVRWPVLVVLVGTVQAVTYAGLYDGYQIGEVLALNAAGVLLRRSASPHDLDAARWTAGRLPAVLGTIGRRPLTAYALHLAALVLFAVAMLGLQ